MKALALVLVGVLAGGPLAAKADVFARLSGLFGDPAFPAEACTANPVFSTFSADHSRVTFNWARPVPSYTGDMITAFGGNVMAWDDTSVTLQRDAESRWTAAGDKVQWIMRATTQPDGYCWYRTDWVDQDCYTLVRCPSDANS